MAHCVTLSGCVTQYPRVGASEASAIHPTHTNVCVECGHMLCGLHRITDTCQVHEYPNSSISKVLTILTL